MGIFTEAVDVRYSAQGEPAEILWRGVLYRIAAHPLRWYERRAWWAEESRMPPGAGVGAVDTQIWRLVLLVPDSRETFSLDVAHYRPSDRWRVIKIYDGLADAVADETQQLPQSWQEDDGA